MEEIITDELVDYLADIFIAYEFDKHTTFKEFLEGMLRVRKSFAKY